MHTHIKWRKRKLHLSWQKEEPEKLFEMDTTISPLLYHIIYEELIYKKILEGIKVILNE